jgi:YesN/AraC family two-component response regulator
MQKKILIVDDEEIILFGIKAIIEKHNFKVDVASNGIQGIALLSQQAYDILITDIIMPEKDGIELIRYTKKLFPNIRIIAISGGGRITDEDHLKKAKELGCDFVIEKPFSSQELIKAIHALN